MALIKVILMLLGFVFLIDKFGGLIWLMAKEKLRRFKVRK